MKQKSWFESLRWRRWRFTWRNVRANALRCALSGGSSCRSFGSPHAHRTNATAVVLYWAVLRIWGSIDPSETTLYNPTKLHEVLSQFVTAGNNNGCSPNERHRTEALCRRLLEDMLNMELPKVRPKWLVNPTTRRCLVYRLAPRCGQSRRLPSEPSGDRQGTPR